MKPLIIVGAGGFGREVFAIVQAINEQEPVWSVEGFVDDAPVRATHRLVADLGSRILGNVASLAGQAPHLWAVVAVGSPTTRAHLVASLDPQGIQWATLIHPDSTIGPRVTLGQGSIVAAGARLSTGIRVGEHAQIDQNCTVGHDSRLADFVRLNPQACVSGNVTVGRGALIGANATILEGRSVGPDAVVGAHACVTRDVSDGLIVKGMPAR